LHIIIIIINKSEAHQRNLRRNAQYVTSKVCTFHVESSYKMWTAEEGTLVNWLRPRLHGLSHNIKLHVRI